ncbi:hypothetical protein RFI_31676 [Reticulomyxa filosa]|uniref:Uncharacterized protein n=1 Tax=Reticulomyxa filosa TaxID=46433 RepID=X6LX53_RETFI|nr:hypothetical protein RFI_31676 [Reticulomyxa filosa]|eukprot:ETO05722.1 hypothetical protein RFI_31676 [Reticulomyxa filosa]
MTVVFFAWKRKKCTSQRINNFVLQLFTGNFQILMSVLETLDDTISFLKSLKEYPKMNRPGVAISKTRYRFASLPKTDYKSNQEYSKRVPVGKYITGVFTNEYVIVYQAFNPTIAKSATTHQTFLKCAEYSQDRMTWIKTNFLWMMHRSEWGKSQNQEHILAIWLKLENFLYLLSNSYLSLYNDQLPYTQREHSTVIKNKKSRVVVQWDPHHFAIGGDKLIDKRAIQIGIKGKPYCDTFHSGILFIEDISDFVHSIDEQRLKETSFLIPNETIMSVPDLIKERLLIG